MKGLERNPIPLWYQLESILREKIESKELQPGDQLPTEMEMCDTYKISRATVRQAIKALEVDGLVERRQGKGTTVRSKSQWAGKRMKVYGSVGDLISLGRQTKLTLISRRLVKLPSHLAEEILLPENEKVYKYKGFRSLERKKNGVRAQVNIYLLKEIGQKIDLKTSRPESTFLEQVEKVAGQRVDRIKQAIGAMAADAKMASDLDVEIGSPILKTTRIYLGKDGRLIECAVTHVAGQGYEDKTEMHMSPEKINLL